MSENPHYQAAQKLLEDEATAGNSWLNPQETETSPMGGLNYGKVAEQIRERLGL